MAHAHNPLRIQVIELFSLMIAVAIILSVTSLMKLLIEIKNANVYLTKTKEIEYSDNENRISDGPYKRFTDKKKDVR